MGKVHFYSISTQHIDCCEHLLSSLDMALLLPIVIIISWHKAMVDWLGCHDSILVVPGLMLVGILPYSTGDNIVINNLAPCAQTPQ